MVIRSLLKPLLPVVMFFLFLAAGPRSYAANGSISVSPVSGSYEAGSWITADIKIDGGGSAFNAAKATVSLVPQQQIQSVILGDCGFAMIKPPTTSNLSFVGALLGTSSNSCTAFTFTFRASAGTQQIILSDGSIKSLHGALELLSHIRNATFTINGNSATNAVEALSPISPTQPPIQSGETKLYTITYSVVLPKGVAPSSVLATLDSNAPAQTNVTQISPQEPAVLTATFEGVVEGAHTLSAFYNNNQIAEQIVNVSGNDKNLSFGNTAKQTSFTWVLMVLLLLAIVGICIGVFFLYKRYKKNIPATL